MALLTTQETKEKIIEQLNRSSDSLQIISAFCKINTLKNLIDNNIRCDLHMKKLLVRFRLEDVISGATDIELYEYCKQNGWELYIRFDLHAKTYIFDKKRCILGSSNLTNSGLGFEMGGNYELSDFVDIDNSDTDKIDVLFENSIKVNDVLYEKLKSEFEISKSMINPNTNIKKCVWSKEVYDMNIPNLKVLFSYNFPNTKSPELNNYESLSFLDCSFPINEDTVKECFLRSNSYLWLKKVLKENNNCLYFGSITKLLHDTLVNDPKPYRKDVKEYLSNLLGWIEYLNIDEIKIDRPNYSQRIILKENTNENTNQNTNGNERRK